MFGILPGETTYCFSHAEIKKRKGIACRNVLNSCVSPPTSIYDICIAVELLSGRKTVEIKQIGKKFFSFILFHFEKKVGIWTTA